MSRSSAWRFAVAAAAVALPLAMPASAQFPPPWQADPFEFPTASDVPRDTIVQSAAIPIIGIQGIAPVRLVPPLLPDAGYSINCTGAFTDAPDTMLDGQTICVRHRTRLGEQTTRIEVGYITGSFITRTAWDTIPEPFAFATVFNAAPGTLYESDPAPISDIYPPLSVYVSGGLLSIGCSGNYASTWGFVADGQSLCIAVRAPAATHTAATAVIQVGALFKTFVVSTGSSLDAIPDPFVFAPIVGVRRGYEKGKGASIITGLQGGYAPLAVVGGFHTTSRTHDGQTPPFVVDKDVVTLSHPSSWSFGDPVTTIATVGGVDGHFTTRTVLRSAITNGTVRDYNGDGYVDLLWRNATTGDAWVWLLDDHYPLNGDWLEARQLMGGRPDWAPTHFGDFDRDGTTDIVWYNASTGETALWLLADGAYKDGAVVVGGGGWKVEHSGDFDGDGRTDLVWRNVLTGQTSMWLMNGLALAAGGPLLFDPAWQVQHTGDFDGDGRADLVWRNSITGATAVWLMNGLAMTHGAIVQVLADWRVAVVGDLDGDDKDDLVWHNAMTGDTAIYLMDGVNRLAGARLPGPTTAPVAASDFEGDGKSDLLFVTPLGVERYRMDGLAVLAVTTELDATASFIRAVDFDGDGRSDVLFSTTALRFPGIWLRYAASHTSMHSVWWNPQLVLTDPGWQLH